MEIMDIPKILTLLSLCLVVFSVIGLRVMYKEAQETIDRMGARIKRLHELLDEYEQKPKIPPGILFNRGPEGEDLAPEALRKAFTVYGWKRYQEQVERRAELDGPDRRTPR